MLSCCVSWCYWTSMHAASGSTTIKWQQIYFFWVQIWDGQWENSFFLRPWKPVSIFVLCFFPLTACGRRQRVKFTCFFFAVVSYVVKLCLSSFRLFSLIPMSILRRCNWNNWLGYTGTWFSFLGHFLLHCRANSSIVDNCWMQMLLCVSSYIFITSNIFFGSPGSVLRRMKMNLIQIC